MAKKTLKKLPQQQIFQIVLVTLLVVAAFAIGVMWTQLNSLKKGSPIAGVPTPTTPEEVTELTEAQWQQVLTNPAAVIGSDDAPVTIVEFTDYQCPWCSEHAGFNAIAERPIDQEKNLQQIMDKYVTTGKVKYVVRDAAYHGPLAVKAAEAARCAGEQDQYFTYHDKLFENQAVWSEELDPSKTFKTYAGQLGLNGSLFATCLDSGKYTSAVNADTALAPKVGASGTPTFFVNRVVEVGAVSFSVFQNLIETALNQ